MDHTDHRNTSHASKKLSASLNEFKISGCLSTNVTVRVETNFQNQSPGLELGNQSPGSIFLIQRSQAKEQGKDMCFNCGPTNLNAEFEARTPWMRETVSSETKFSTFPLTSNWGILFFANRCRIEIVLTVTHNPPYTGISTYAPPHKAVGRTRIRTFRVPTEFLGPSHERTGWATRRIAPARIRLTGGGLRNTYVHDAACFFG